MSCIRMPVSLADANAIVACFGGADWRGLFVTGLETALVVGGLLWLAAIALRRRA